MGMFDTVWFPCPDCTESIGAQTKVGECDLTDYDPSEVPMVIAGALHGRVEKCTGCGTEVKIVVLVGPNVAMAAIKE
jgi:predicted RNA-binding Zn-ribbon protein involved in translation (DUF1610 family)